jgi:DNA-binding FadR family transcriptional regulator
VPALLTIWRTIVARIRRHFRQTTAQYAANFLDIYEDHRRLVEVFRSGQREAALKALEEHIS